MSNKIKFTPEQLDELQSFFQQNDFTANMTLNRECNLKGKQAEIFVRTKKIFGEYWLENLRPLGVNRKMKNFSKDFPVNLLENVDADYFSEQISEIYTDPDKLNERSTTKQNFKKQSPETIPYPIYTKSCMRIMRKFSDEWFMQLSHKYETERLELKAKIKALRQKLSECGRREQERENFTSAIRRFMRMDRLTAPLLSELIDHIDVFETEGKGKNRTQRIVIYYRFVGYVKIPEVSRRPNIVADTRKGVATKYLTEPKTA